MIFKAILPFDNPVDGSASAWERIPLVRDGFPITWHIEAAGSILCTVERPRGTSFACNPTAATPAVGVIADFQRTNGDDPATWISRPFWIRSLRFRPPPSGWKFGEMPWENDGGGDVICKGRSSSVTLALYALEVSPDGAKVTSQALIPSLGAPAFDLPQNWAIDPEGFVVRDLYVPAREWQIERGPSYKIVIVPAIVSAVLVFDGRQDGAFYVDGPDPAVVYPQDNYVASAICELEGLRENIVAAPVIPIPPPPPPPPGP